MTIQLSHEIKAAMDRVVSGLSTKSDKIRALGKARYQRADIARYLNIRYQHVRNVLEEAKQNITATKAKDMPDPGSKGPPRQDWAQIGLDGRVVIPAPYRRALGIEAGGHVLMRLEGDELRLVGRDAALRRAQELVARYVPEKTSLADELIAERRAEVERESRE
ncbi:MAG: AbrB/MazE/SpoVT family DNA-binding domain-containing protein [Rhodospirillales bacterium]